VVKSNGTVVQRGTHLPHPYGVRIEDGPYQGFVMALDTTEPEAPVGAAVTIKFHPDDQFATIIGVA
jgi:hypothetical protein